MDEPDLFHEGVGPFGGKCLVKGTCIVCRKVVADDRDRMGAGIPVNDIGDEAREVIPLLCLDNPGDSSASQWLHAQEHVCRPVSDVHGIIVHNPF